MYRHLGPGEARELPMRMLFQPAAGGLFLKACEADSWRGLVAALVNDRAYESADAETRLVQRLRLADDAALLAELQDTFSGVRLTALGDMQRPPLDGPVDRRHSPRGELLPGAAPKALLKHDT